MFFLFGLNHFETMIQNIQNDPKHINRSKKKSVASDPSWERRATETLFVGIASNSDLASSTMGTMTGNG
jgi:hypothetical protein